MAAIIKVAQAFKNAADLEAQSKLFIQLIKDFEREAMVPPVRFAEIVARTELSNDPIAQRFFERLHAHMADGGDILLEQTSVDKPAAIVDPESITTLAHSFSDAVFLRNQTKIFTEMINLLYCHSVTPESFAAIVAATETFIDDVDSQTFFAALQERTTPIANKNGFGNWSQSLSKE